MARMSCLVVLVVAFSPAHAQTPGGSDEAVIEEVVLVGTRRAARDVHGLAVPMDVLNAEQLNTQGDGDILDTLASLVPSYNVAREPISDAATLIRPANMRGLPADNTLVLVNGKRRHRGAVIGEFVSGINKGAQAVDIAPLAGIALKQVEVLRNGASAQYGSDAVAGVMNFVLQDDPDARRLQAQYGSTFVGDGDQIMLSGAFGTDLGSDGFATLSFELKDSAPTSRGSQDPQATYLVENGYMSIADPIVIWGSPDIENDFKLLFNAATQAGVGERYGFGTWSGREVDGSFFYRNPNTRSGVFADGTGNLLVADLTPGDDMPCRTVPVVAGLADSAALDAVMADPDCFVFNEWFPGGFTPRFGGEVGDASIVAGWRGTRTGGLNHDFSVSAGRNEVVYRIRNTVNASYGPHTPRAFDLGAQIQFERLINADFAWPVDIGAASDLNVAFGAQHHREVFEMVAGDTESWAPGGFETQGFSVGSNGFQGFSADVAGRFSRESASAYVDLEVDLTERWLADAALRYDRFSDFGSTTNGKLASRFTVSDGFAVRVAAGTGFRAPSIGQSNLRRAATVIVDGQLAESLTLPPTNPVAMLKGGRQLAPEESVHWGLGALFSLGPADITLDWFRIAVDGRIALTQQSLSEQDRIDLVAARFVGAETVTAVSFFVNDIDTETTGLDLTAQTGFDWIGGRVNLALASNITRTDVIERGLSAESSKRFQRRQLLRAPWREPIESSSLTKKVANAAYQPKRRRIARLGTGASAARLHRRDLHRSPRRDADAQYRGTRGRGRTPRYAPRAGRVGWPRHARGARIPGRRPRIPGCAGDPRVGTGGNPHQPGRGWPAQRHDAQRPQIEQPGRIVRRPMLRRRE